VGEKGMALSGGQKTRLALARALYYDADIYLLDDPISAVDAKVAKRIYENVILKMRGLKTIVLVTHQISYIFECDLAIIMENGRVEACGKP
jgi:ATP-binding cassette subfamily C (CFTR/MRP) protein 4